MSYILKQKPEDFVVSEISNVKIEKNGRYCYFLLRKTSRNTLDVVKELARQTNLREKDIGFAGSKDKHAVTKQIISVPSSSKEKSGKATIDQVSLKFLGYGSQPIFLGNLKGNNFDIMIRNLDKFSISKTTYLENYFDEQRFSLHNREIGKHLIEKDFEKALSLIDDNRANRYLKNNSNDYIGALKKLPLRLLRMYVNAFQSFLWNETIASYLRKKGKILKEVSYSLGKLAFVSNYKNFLGLSVPLIGFSTKDIIDDKKTDKDIKNIIEELMKKEKIDYFDFVIKQIPEISLEGESRKVFVNVENLDVKKIEKDELNKGRNKIRVSFFLPKGSYATMLIKKIIKED